MGCNAAAPLAQTHGGEPWCLDVMSRSGVISLAEVRAQSRDAHGQVDPEPSMAEVCLRIPVSLGGTQPPLGDVKRPVRCKKGLMTGPGEPVAGDTSSQLGPSIRKAATAPALCTQLPAPGGRFKDVVIPPACSLKTHGCTRPSFRRRLAFIPHTQAPWASPHLQFWGSPDGRVVREPALLRSPPAAQRSSMGQEAAFPTLSTWSSLLRAPSDVQDRPSPSRA